MKKSLLFLFIAVICGCNKEADVEPARESTFLRYFGSEQNDEAVLALEDTDDDGGFALLSTEEIETGVSGQIKNKIHFIHTDQFGNLEWEFSYPKPVLDDEDNDISENLTAASFIEIPGSGYLIIGTRINPDNTTDLQLVNINTTPTGDKELPDYYAISLRTPQKPLLSLKGNAIIADRSDFVVLGSIEENEPQDMFIARVLGSDLDSCSWKREYGDSPTTLINRLYLNNSQNVWAGSVFFNNTFDARIVRVDPNTQPTQIGGNIGSVEFDENALDFCKAVGGWVITGYTNDSENNQDLTEDIFVMKVNDASTQIFKTQLQGVTGKNERGMSITATSDQCYVVLGTVGTVDKSDDLFLQKINDSGVEVWKKKNKDGITVPNPRYYGGADKQEAASVRETSDGSLLIFGTTYFGSNEKKLMLLKVNKNGEL